MTARMENGLSWTHTYNTENRLASMTDGVTTWLFSYDGDGTLVGQLVTDGVTATHTAFFMGGGTEVISDGVTETVRKYYALAGHTFGMSDNGVMKYLISDHLGSTVAITDNTGNVFAETRYMPFGEPRADAGSLAGTDKTFTGQRDVPDTGLMDYRARMYSAQLGRFIQPDTIVPGAGNSQAWNRYGYVLNRPINYTDPSGHKVCDAKNGLNDCISTKEVQQVIQKLYGWTLIGSWSSKETDNVLVTATNMEDSLRIITGSSGKHWMENNIGKVNIKKGNVSCPPYKCNYSNPFPYTNQVVMNSGTMNDLETGRHILVHEIAHLIDKNSGYLKMGTLFGGGYSDQMVMDLGGDPTRSASGGYRASGLGTIGKNGVSLFRDAIFRFEWGGFEMPKENRWVNAAKGNDTYGDQDGPDYFANAFAYTLFGSPNVVVPQNASNWMNSFLINN